MTVREKTTMAAPKEVSVDVVTASVISELQSISSLKEGQRTALEAFLNGRDVFALLLRHIICRSDWLKLARDRLTDRWLIQSPANFLYLPFSKQFPRTNSQMVLCNKPPGTSGYRIDTINLT